MSYWCAGVKLPNWYKEKIKKSNAAHINAIRVLALAVNQRKRKAYLDSLLNRNMHLLDKIDVSIQKIILSILYLGEGAKHKSTQVLLLGNSDPKVIKFFLKLFKNCYNIDESKLRVRIRCRFDQNINELLEFWHKVTKIRKEQFYPTYIDRRTQGKPTLKKEYKGVCTIQYFSTEIQLELEFLANAIMNKII